jgi:hypothetical protein
VDFLADGFRQGCGFDTRTHQVIRIRKGSAEAPVDGGAGRAIQSLFAGVGDDAANFSGPHEIVVEDFKVAAQVYQVEIRVCA